MPSSPRAIDVTEPGVLPGHFGHLPAAEVLDAQIIPVTDEGWVLGVVRVEVASTACLPGPSLVRTAIFSDVVGGVRIPLERHADLLMDSSPDPLGESLFYTGVWLLGWPVPFFLLGRWQARRRRTN